MKRTPFYAGCLALNSSVVALVAIVCVVVISLLRGGVLFSPGALNAMTATESLGGVRAHAEISACDQCHPSPWSGQSMTDRCLTCHTDLKLDPKNFHNIMRVQGQISGCNRCHTEHRGPAAVLTLLDLQSFPHQGVGFSLQAHSKMADGSQFQCVACHTEGYTRFNPAVCSTCHQKLNATFLDSHTAGYGQDCLACHDGLDSYGKNFDHQKVAFPLLGKHNPTACVQCHAGAQSAAVLKSTPQNCSACHAQVDPHKGDLGQDCGQCHTPQDWQSATIDHKLTAFPLLGKHQAAACQDCHTNQVFKGTSQDCIACHAKEDVHQASLGKDCGQCHTPQDWQSATIDHKLTAFPLLGKHQAAACQDCHTNQVFKGTSKDCIACHAKEDVHQASFGKDCGQCHTPQDWQSATIDHKLTAFPLLGKHLAAACQDCHVNRVFKGTSSLCFACHAKADAHNGQFGQDCGLCHTSAGWLPSIFNHTKTNFQLSGAHLKVACTGCHVQKSSGITFKGTPAACGACHGEPGYHSGLLGTNCGSCHNTGAWTPAKFNQAHAFPVNHGGGSGGCHTCHTKTLREYTCYTCHDSGQIASRHNNEGISNISNCISCHANGRKEGGG